MGSFELTQARFFPSPEGVVATTGDLGVRAGDVLDLGVEALGRGAAVPEGRRISREGRGGTETGVANEEGMVDRAVPELDERPICERKEEKLESAC